MLKEAIKEIKEMAVEGSKINYTIIDHKVYTKDKNGELVYVCEESTEAIIPKRFIVTSLDGMVNRIKDEVSKRKGKLYIEIGNFNEVNCYTERGEVRPEEIYNLFTVSSTNNTFREGYRDYETAIIELRSKYQPTEDVSYLLKLLSSMTIENKATTDDNGLTQQITVKKGVALSENVIVKPIVKLRPYRTFYEVPQPESEFLVRIGDNGTIGFFEADGGMWKMTARHNIKDYFEYELTDEIKAGKVIVSL